MKILITYAIFAIGLSLASAQIPAPQIALTGNIGCQGFPCVNNGTLIFTSDADHTMTARETSAFYIKVTSSVSLTATRNLIAPLGNFPFTIENATTGGQSIQIIGASGTGVTIANGSTVSVWNDGTNFVQSGLSGSYLPLGGGTLTGALNGTSASFSGAVSAGGVFDTTRGLPVFADSQIGGTPYLTIATPGSGQIPAAYLINGPNVTGGGCSTEPTAVAVVVPGSQLPGGTVTSPPIVTSIGIGCTSASTFTMPSAACSGGCTLATFTAAFPYLTYTDPCSQLAGLAATDVANGVSGGNYSDNTASGTVNCGVYGFFAPATQVQIDNTVNSGQLTVSPGITYGVSGPIYVPNFTQLNGVPGFGSTITTGNFKMNPYGAIGGTSLVALGPPIPSGSSIAEFGLGPQVNNLKITCGGVPTLQGGSNFVGQQLAGFHANYFYQCSSPIVLGTAGNSGGSQNAGSIDDNQIGLTDAPAFPVITGISLSNPGTGYLADFLLIVTGDCTTPPTGLMAETLAGALTGRVYAAGTSLGATSYGDCPGDSSGVTLSFANGSGAGAAGVPIIQTLTTNSGIYSYSGHASEINRNSAVGGGLAIPPPYGYDFENMQGLLFAGNYSESAGNGFCWACVSTGVSAGLTAMNFETESANNAGYAAARLGRTGKVGADLFNIQSSMPWILRDDGAYGGDIPVMVAINGAGNAGWLNAYIHTPSDAVFSADWHVTSNLTHGFSAPDCGSGGCGSGGGLAVGYPVKQVGGDFRRMVSGDTVDPVGIWTNGVGGTGYGTAYGGTAADIGWAACVFDNTPTAGDYVQLGAETPAECDDTGSATDPTSGTTIGIVGDPLRGGSLTAPTTPTVSGVTATVTGASTITDTYKFVAVTDSDLSASAASSAVTVTNAPQALTGGINKISFASLPTTNDLAVYRTAIGQTIPSTFTIYCGPDGTATGTSSFATLSSGVTFAPTWIATGGGFSPEPTGTTQVVGGLITGINFTTRGAGCSTNATGTFTASTSNIGFIGYSNHAATFIDSGQPGDGTTPPASAVIGPQVYVKIQHWYGNGTGNVTASGAFTVGHVLAAANTGGTSVIDGGATAIAATNTFNGGDVICAHGGDTTVGSETITAGTANSLTLSAIQTVYVLPGTQLGVTGATPSGLNGGPYTVLSRSGNIITFTANLPATWTSGGTAYLYCSNSADAIGTAAYATNNAYTVSALAAGSSYSQRFQLQYWTPATAQYAYFWQKYGSAVVYENAADQALLASASGKLGSVGFTDSAPTSALMLSTMDTAALGTSTPNYTSGLLSPVGVPSSGALEMGLYFSANGLGSVTSASGGTISSITAGQTCTLGTFNDSLSSSAAVTVTFANNASWTGATFTVTNTGYGATAAPTSATLSSGTGTCSGTPTLVTVLGGAQGTAIAVTSARTAQ
jgi:hypothetical protein